MKHFTQMLLGLLQQNAKILVMAESNTNIFIYSVATIRLEIEEKIKIRKIIKNMEI